jgi:hypothetical protein
VAPVLGREIPLPPALAERMAFRPVAVQSAPQLAAVRDVLDHLST